MQQRMKSQIREIALCNPRENANGEEASNPQPYEKIRCPV
jgi:hypothetical protein